MANKTPVKAYITEGAAVALGEFEATDTIAGALVDPATDEAAGVVELATEADVYTGTDTAKAITPAALAGSYNFGRKAVEIHIVPDDTDVDTVSGVAYLKCPQMLHLMKLVRAQAFVHTAGTTNATTVQVRNLSQFPDDDALSSAVSIASGDTVGTAAVGDGTHNQVSTNSNLKIYVTGQSTTKPQGLYVVLEFEL